MNRNTLVNSMLGLVGAALVLTSIVLVSSHHQARQGRAGDVNLRKAGATYRERVRAAKSLLESDSQFTDIELSSH